MGRLERDGTGVLEHNIHNDHSRHHSVVCLRTPHMVLVLPDGHTFGPGHTQEIAVPQGIYKCNCRLIMPDEMQELCQGLPDADNAL